MAGTGTGFGDSFESAMQDALGTGVGAGAGAGAGVGTPFDDLEALAVAAAVVGDDPDGFTPGMRRFLDMVRGLEIHVVGFHDAYGTAASTGAGGAEGDAGRMFGGDGDAAAHEVMGTFQAPAALGAEGTDAPEELQDIWKCCICLEVPNAGDDIGLLRCMHRFHKACITQALTVGVRAQCPQCRRSVYAGEDEDEAGAGAGAGVRVGGRLFRDLDLDLDAADAEEGGDEDFRVAATRSSTAARSTAPVTRSMTRARE